MAYLPPTKKSFSYSALACWGERLATEPNCHWEEFIAMGHIVDGQHLYRKISHPVAIFLEDKSATVQFRTEEEGDIHIIFSLGDNNILHWRTSLEEREQASPFAVAALYFIEEFVAEEFPKIPEGTFQTRERPQSIQSPKATPKEQAPTTEQTRNLILKFQAKTTALFCYAKWQDAQGKCVPALGENSQTPQILNAEERSQLLRLATFARKAFFSYDSKAMCYSVYGMPLASSFANTHADKWKKYFKIENPEEIEIFRSKPKELEAQAILSSDNEYSFSLKWNFLLDGNELSAKEIDSIISHSDETIFLPKHGLVHIKKNSQNFVSDWPDAQTHGIPIYTLLSLFRNDKETQIIPDAKLQAWKKKILATPKLPANIPNFLRPYQALGVAWIRQMFERNIHPLIADEMGLGKTLQVLAALALDTQKRSRALIVCPASVVPVWENEIQKFFPSQSYSVLGKNLALLAPKTIKTKIVISSYGQLRRHAEELHKNNFTYAILDEAQFIKNPSTKVTQACLKIQAKHRLALTGTPIENRHLDLWTLFRFLMPGLLGRKINFEETLVNPQGSEAALNLLKTQIAPFILRRTKDEVAKELPAKIQNTLSCPMLPLQREHYQRLVQEGLKNYITSNGNTQISTQTALRKNPSNLLTLLMRLRQAACDPALLPGCQGLSDEFSGKIVALLERTREIIDNGGKIVVFSQFVMLLNRVQDAMLKNFPDVPQFLLTGKTLDRDTPVKAFQDLKGPGIFLISLRAGGTGLTLHSAEYVFLLDPWWNPAVEEQAIDRVHRIGQKKRVFVYRMVAAGTIEERIEKLKQDKRKLFNQLVGGIPDMSNWASHYPSLESLIALSE